MIKKLVLERKILKKSKSRGIRHFGFTLLEVLISLVLLGVGLTVSTKVFVAGKYFMKESENKTRAMEIASVHMNEYLAKTYEELVAGQTPDVTENGFTWTANIQSTSMPPLSGTLKNIIPYKTIEIVCWYNEQNINAAVVKKSVRLLNMVVYPYLHLFSKVTSPTTSVCPFNSPSTIIDLDFDTLVRSDLLIFYNVSINFTDPTTIGAADLIVTKCFIYDKNSGVTYGYDIQTGTPIATQPSISNTVSVDSWPPGAVLPGTVIPNGLPKGNYTLRILWNKDHDSGIIKGKKANVVIFQVEK